MIGQLRFRTLYALVLAGAGFALPSAAGTITTVPPSLAPGSQYRLVFVTSGFFTATSTTIGAYNTEVNNEANGIAALAALSTTWVDIGSTATVNAIDNIGIDAGVPIYDLSGNKVATDAGTGAGGMFSGALLHGIATTDTGTQCSGCNVWSGTLTTGQLNASLPLGAVGGSADIGIAGASGSTWIQDNSPHPTNNVFTLYGISGVLTSPAPEPSTWFLFGSAVLGMVMLRKARRASR